jgi:hypothetical protein
MPEERDTYAVAEPTKRLFLSLLTRDISLEDAILDLVDNSINSAIRIRNLDMVDHFDDFIAGRLSGEKPLSKIEIRFSADRFEITDDCGGIPLNAAENSVFRFGREDAPIEGDVLSVYGVGLKRALFKIGDHIQVSSQDASNAFIVEDHARSWAARAETEWRFPLHVLRRDRSKPDGTRIVLLDILPEIQEVLGDSSFGQAIPAHKRNLLVLYRGNLSNFGQRQGDRRGAAGFGFMGRQNSAD